MYLNGQNIIPFFQREELTGFILVISNFYLYFPMHAFELVFSCIFDWLSGEQYEIGVLCPPVLNPIFRSLYIMNTNWINKTKSSILTFGMVNLFFSPKSGRSMRWVSYSAGPGPKEFKSADSHYGSKISFLCSLDACIIKFMF